MNNLSKTQELNTVYPGEQWFFYWKTSAVLWERLISESPQGGMIFIPLNWGQHHMGNMGWDFGEERPELDILRLAQTLLRHNKHFCWLMPLSPAPFLPNGGLPVSASKVLGKSREGIHYAIFDHEDQLNKMYSFFGGGVFNLFDEFVQKFGTLISSNKLKAPVFGLHSHYFDNGQLISFIEDSSQAFEQGFSRYLKKNFPEGLEIENPIREREFKQKFTTDVAKFFETCAESQLPGVWHGLKNITFLGAGFRDSLERALPAGKSPEKISHEIATLFYGQELLSSCLLKPTEKTEIISWMLEDLYGDINLRRSFGFEGSMKLIPGEFSPFGLMDLISLSDAHFRENGLVNYLDEFYPWLYQKQREFEFSIESIEANQDKVKIFLGKDLDRTGFSQALKLFLMGQKVILDTSGLSDILEKKLQLFVIENNLKVQNVNFIIPTKICELGEGAFIFFDGTLLKANESSSKYWTQIFKFFKLIHPKVIFSEGVFHHWKLRKTKPEELAYLDVRRLSLYNPTSYKKIV